jgi:hypothetical protein
LAAHDAFLHGDLASLTANLDDVLQGSPAPHVEANALELLEAAFELQPHLPTAQQLPDGVLHLALDQVHRVGPDGHRFRLVVRAHATNPGVIESLAVESDAIDPTTGVFTTRPENDYTYAELEFPDQPLPHEPGRVTLVVTVNGTPHRLWTALTGEVARDVPAVAFPYPGQIVSESHPVVSFDPSPGRDVEASQTGIYLARTSSSTAVWFELAAADVTEARVPVELAEGDYWLAVSRRDIRSLGPVALTRVARRGVPFQVRR